MKLYHGTNKMGNKKIRSEGLRPIGRRHLFNGSYRLDFIDKDTQVLKSKYYSQLNTLEIINEILRVFNKFNLSFKGYGFNNDIQDDIFFSYINKLLNDSYNHCKDEYYKELDEFYKKSFPDKSIDEIELMFEKELDKALEIFKDNALAVCDEIIKKAYNEFINKCNNLGEYKSFMCNLNGSLGDYNYLLLDWGNKFNLSNYIRNDAIFLKFDKDRAECYGDIVYEIDSEKLDYNKLFIFNWSTGDIVIEMEQLGFIPGHYEMDFEDLKDYAKYYWKKAVSFKNFIKDFNSTNEFPFTSCELLYFDKISANIIKQIK